VLISDDAVDALAQVNRVREIVNQLVDGEVQRG
jgi:hypothetical protein